MRKAMLSQPMAGKTQEEIAATREKAVAALKARGFEVINTLFTDEWYSKEKMEERGVVQIPLCFLAKSLENMSLCHAAYFCIVLLAPDTAGNGDRYFGSLADFIADFHCLLRWLTGEAVAVFPTALACEFRPAEIFNAIPEIACIRFCAVILFHIGVSSAYLVRRTSHSRFQHLLSHRSRNAVRIETVVSLEADACALTLLSPLAVYISLVVAEVGQQKLYLLECHSIASHLSGNAGFLLHTLHSVLPCHLHLSQDAIPAFSISASSQKPPFVRRLIRSSIAAPPTCVPACANPSQSLANYSK